MDYLHVQADNSWNNYYLYYGFVKVVEEHFLFVGVTVLDSTVKYIVLKLMNFRSSTYITLGLLRFAEWLFL